MAGDETREDVAQVGKGLDAVEPTGLDERGNDGPAAPTAVAAREQRILSCKDHRPQGALDRVGIELDPAVIEEAGEALPARQRIADRLRELTLGGDPGE